MQQKWAAAIAHAQQTDLSTIQRSIAELEQFMDGPEGATALQLLAVAQTRVHFGEAAKNSLLANAWLLTADGLVRSTYTSPHADTAPVIVPLTSQLFVLEIARQLPQFKEGVGIVPFIISELDRIADSILAL